MGKKPETHLILGFRQVIGAPVVVGYPANDLREHYGGHDPDMLPEVGGNNTCHDVNQPLADPDKGQRGHYPDHTDQDRDEVSPKHRPGNPPQSPHACLEILHAARECYSVSNPASIHFPAIVAASDAATSGSTS